MAGDIKANASLENEERGQLSPGGDGVGSSRGGFERMNSDFSSQAAARIASSRRQTASVRKVYCKYSLGLFSKSNTVRRACIRIAESTAFEVFIITAIVLNCTFLALTEPTKDDSSGRNKLVNDSEIPFSVLFIVEACIKIMATGLYFESNNETQAIAKSQKKAVLGKYFPPSVRYVYVPTYLKDGWNVLDFIVVVGGIISLSGTKSSVSSIRTIRVLRPLRTISALPGMRILVGIIIRSLPMMGNVMLLSAFLFIVFGIMGVQLFKGVLKNRCFAKVPASAHALGLGLGQAQTQTSLSANATGLFPLPVDEERVCALSQKYLWGGHLCSTGEVCAEYGNPNYGITSFDNILWAFLTIFQIITLEGWTPIMYNVMDATSRWSMWYFVLLIGMGAFFLINLAVGIVTEVYDQVQDEDENEYEEEEEQKMDLYTFLDLESAGDPGISRLQSMCQLIIEHVLFDPFFTVLIVVNTILLAMEYDNMPADYENNLNLLNLILTYSFVVEMVLKIGGKQAAYFKDKSDLFDMLVTVISVIEMSFASNGSLTALRAFRILRILRLFRRWKSLQDFLKILAETVSNLGNFTFIVILVVFIYALLGMDLFGDNFHFEDGRPRHNFDTLLWSVVSVFQILTGEDWNAIMYDGIRATSSVSAFYFISLILIGQYIILNLFIAILLSNFGAQHEEEEKEEKKKIEILSHSKKTFQRMMVSAKRHMSTIVLKVGTVFGISRKESYVTHETGESEVLEDERFHNFIENAKLLDLDDLQTLAESKELDNRQRELLKKLIDVRNKRSTSGAGSNASSFRARSASIYSKSQNEDPRQLFGNSLGLFSPENKVRKFLFRIIDDWKFEYFILALILLSSVAMACEVPRPSAKEEHFFYILDIVFLVIFGLEALMKIVAFGFVFGKNHYLHDPWNVMDFIIVLMSFFGVALASLAVEGLSIFRIMRTLRPLRFLGRVPQLKVVVNALMNSIPALGNVAVVSIIFYIICGILSMQLFMGKFHYCTADVCCTTSTTSTNMTEPVCNQVLAKNDCMGYTDSISSGKKCSWENERMNFDSIYDSLLTLFEMSTTEGWTIVMYAAVDATGKDKQRIRDHNPVYALYFLVLMVFLSFFILNLFVGIILDTFSEMQRKNNYASNFLTPEQQTWVDSQKMAFTSNPKPIHMETGSKKKWLLKWVDSSYFETGILLLITANIGFMMLENENQEQWVTDTLYVSNFVFTMIFLLEAVIKISVLSMNKINYFADKWNRFDFLVVLLSIFGLISGNNGSGASVFRVFRIARVFRLVKRLNGLNILFKTLLISIPTMLNVGGLMFIFFFIFAVLGMNLFGKVDSGETYANFQSFGWSLLTLLRMSTGEAWNSIMEVMMVQSPDCERAKEPYCKDMTSNLPLPSVTEAACVGPEMSWITVLDNCGSEFAVVYMVAFILFGSFIFLNLVIAVVLENFSLMLKLDAGPITPLDIRSFEAAWSAFDPRAKGYIMQDHLKKLSFSIPPPLGLEGQRIKSSDLENWIRELNLGLKPFYSYHEVLGALLVRAVKDNDVAASIPEEVKILMDIQLKKSLTRRVSTQNKKRQTKYRRLVNKADVLFATITIQRVCRKWLWRKERSKKSKEGTEGGV